MFFGKYEFSIDEKGRLVIPTKFRTVLGNETKLYVLKGYDGCLSVFQESNFLNYISKLQSLAFEKQKVRLHERILSSSVVEIDIDKQNRMLIPSKTLKEYEIGRSVIIVGVIDHFEIWDSEKWKEYQTSNEKDFETVAEDLLTNEN